MKPLKVFWNGKLLREIYPHATPFQVFKYKLKKFLRKVFIGITGTAIIVAVFHLGGIINPKLEFQTVEAVREVEKLAPVLARIAKCESNNKHFDKNGQVLMRSNTNRSVDIGRYQINTVWFAKATELGFDLTTEQGNEAMAMWIYQNKGTQPWYSSSKCWQ